MGGDECAVSEVLERTAVWRSDGAGIQKERSERVVHRKGTAWQSRLHIRKMKNRTVRQDLLLCRASFGASDCHPGQEFVDQSAGRTNVPGQLSAVCLQALCDEVFPKRMACCAGGRSHCGAVLSWLGSDEAVRAVVFVASMKGIDHKKALRVVFYVTLTGMAVLAILSLAGVLGEVWDAGAGYGIKEGSRRLCLGVGNSNALAIMIWALMTLGVYLFHEKMKPVHWMLLGVLTVGVYAATMTRTTFLIMAATLVAGVCDGQVLKNPRRQRCLYRRNGSGCGGLCLFLVRSAYFQLV